jgi:hypothetical protein
MADQRMTVGFSAVKERLRAMPQPALSCRFLNFGS